MFGTPGSRIKRLRENKEWSQIELARRLGINNSVLSRIEADKRPIESELLLKFAGVFNVSTDYILGQKTSITNDQAKNAAIEAYNRLPPSKKKLVDDLIKALNEGEQK